MSRLLTISLFIKACQKRESFVLWRGAQSTVSGSSFSCHEFMGLGSVLYLFIFPQCRSPAEHWKMPYRIFFCCREDRFQTLCSSSCSTEFKHRLRKHPSGAGQLFICGSPQLAGVLKSIFAFVTYLCFSQGYILLSSLPVRKLNKVMQCYGTSVRHFQLRTSLKKTDRTYKCLSDTPAMLNQPTLIGVVCE